MNEGEPGSVQRQALLTAARRYGLPLLLPARAMLETAALRPEHLAQPDIAPLERIARDWGGDGAFIGHMRFSPEALGWIAEWRVSAGGRAHTWRIEGVNFDEAFRHAVRGSALILSGNGLP
jgi:hypothetical protein